MKKKTIAMVAAVPAVLLLGLATSLTLILTDVVPMKEWQMRTLKTLTKLPLALTSSSKEPEEAKPPRPPQKPGKASELTQELKVMSFNVFTRIEDEEYSLKRRLDGVVQTIRSEMPDSVGLQEAHELWRSSLKRALSDDYAIACNRGRYFGVEEGTPIFYLKEKYELVEEGVFWLSARPNISSRSWDASMPRVAGYAILRDKQTGFTYAHFNTHYDHISEVARINSSRLMADEINLRDWPTVFTGDLNTPPSNRAIQYLASGGLQDLRDLPAVTDRGATFHGYNSETSDEQAIDYVLANHYLQQVTEFKVIRDAYDGIYPSDHFAVMAKFTMAGKEMERYE